MKALVAVVFLLVEAILVENAHSQCVKQGPMQIIEYQSPCYSGLPAQTVVETGYPSQFIPSTPMFPGAIMPSGPVWDVTPCAASKPCTGPVTVLPQTQVLPAPVIPSLANIQSILPQFLPFPGHPGSGIMITGESLFVDGCVTISGSLPFTTFVTLDGSLPAAGYGSVSNVCNCGNQFLY